MKIHLDGVILHYDLVGTGRPILLLHGQSADHRYLRHELAPIFESRPGWMQIYLDLPGHGQSESTNQIHTHAQILDLLLEFLGWVIPQQRFAVLGASYGGYLARCLLRNESTRVDGLALIAPMMVANQEKRAVPQHRILQSNPELLATLSPETQWIFEDYIIVQTEEAARQIETLMNPARAVRDKELLARLASSEDCSFHLAEPFENPTLILTGRQDSVVGYQDQWKILEDFPRATYAVLDKAGHFLWVAEQRPLATMLIQEWLDRIEAESSC